MSIVTTPSRTFGSGAPAGPCMSAAYIKAGADALGVKCEIDRHGISFDGVRFATLAEADVWLDAHAVNLGEQLAHRAALEFEDAHQILRRRDAQVAHLGEHPFTPKNILPEALRF